MIEKAFYLSREQTLSIIIGNPNLKKSETNLSETKLARQMNTFSCLKKRHRDENST
jgi:hypothetical protein